MCSSIVSLFIQIIIVRNKYLSVLFCSDRWESGSGCKRRFRRNFCRPKGGIITQIPHFSTHFAQAHFLSHSSCCHHQSIHMLFANTTHSPSRRNRSSDLTPRTRELAKDMREKFGFPSAGEMRRGNGRSHHDDAENATKETKSVQSSSLMVMNNTRDLPKSPLRDSTNSPLRSASKEIRVSMSANVNQWRSERAEKNVTSSSTTNTPTRLREVKMASTQTKEVTKEKKADVDVFGTRSMMAASRAKSSNATATAVVKEKDTTTTRREASR